MARLLIVIVLLMVAVMFFMPGRGNSPADPGPAETITAVRRVLGETSPRFQARLDAGADCAELISLRDSYDPASSEFARMDQDLQSIGCVSAASSRIR